MEYFDSITINKQFFKIEPQCKNYILSIFWAKREFQLSDYVI